MSIQTHIRRPEMISAPTNHDSAAAPQTIGNQSMEALASGRVAPSGVTLGRRLDLPDAIRSKMETSFGADFSSVQLYESQAVADAGASAMASGGKIGFAPGRLNLASQSGQALLGHELSHVVSQARGQVSGSGFLADSGLEARADQEGAMAASAESVYSGPVAPLSASSVASASGPMQAEKDHDVPDLKQQVEDEKKRNLSNLDIPEKETWERYGEAQHNLDRMADEALTEKSDLVYKAQSDEFGWRGAKMKLAHRDAVDDLNNHYEDYQKMSFGKRFNWSRKNLWARMTASGKTNDTAKRNLLRKKSEIQQTNPFRERPKDEPEPEDEIEQAMMVMPDSVFTRVKWNDRNKK